MTTILDTIFEQKRQRVGEAKSKIDYTDLIERARKTRSNSESHRFRNALSNRDQLNIIAEFKKASPSKGVINDSDDVMSIATAYENGGAAAMSVLTEEDHFKGSLDDLRAARAAVSLPILRKDFTFDEFQIYEAAEAGADAILLIVASLNQIELASLHAVADELRIDTLVEVHSAEEMEIAKSIGARLIGVNNRDLKTFNVDLQTSLRLAKLIPGDRLFVVESGIHTKDDVQLLLNAGADAFLIGEHFLTSADPAAAIRGLL